MWIKIFNWFVKITAWPVQKIIFGTEIFNEDVSVQKRAVRGPAIIICNHTSVYDYAVLLFVFFSATLRVQMAEVLFKKFPLGIFLKMMGGIYVDRNSRNFGFIVKSEDILNRKGIVGIFPESRIPLKDEERPLPFKTSAAFLALSSGAPVIPVYTDGHYFGKGHARVMIGCPFFASDLEDPAKNEKENLQHVTDAMREKIIALGRLLEKHE